MDVVGYSIMVPNLCVSTGMGYRYAQVIDSQKSWEYMHVLGGWSLWVISSPQQFVIKCYNSNMCQNIKKAGDP